MGDLTRDEILVRSVDRPHYPTTAYAAPAKDVWDAIVAALAAGMRDQPPDQRQATVIRLHPEVEMAFLRQGHGCDPGIDEFGRFRSIKGVSVPSSSELSNIFDHGGEPVVAQIVWGSGGWISKLVNITLPKAEPG